MTKFEQLMEYAVGRKTPYAGKIEDKCLRRKTHIANLLGGLSVSREITQVVPVNYSVIDAFCRDLPQDNVQQSCFARKCSGYLTQEMVSLNSIEVASIQDKERFINYVMYNLPSIKGQVKIGKMIRILYGQLYADKWSKIVQSTKATGILTISVAPVDFLTMSQAASNWGSCYAWNGCYRRGILAYMEDIHTAVAYVHSGKEYEFEWGTMPQKQWRQLIHIDLDNKSAVFARQYPNTNDNYAETARSLLGECFANYFSIPNSRKTKSIDEDMFIDYDIDHYYCDVKRQLSNGTAMRMESGFYPSELDLNNNDHTMCPVCGNRREWTNESLSCDDCDTTCWHCDKVVTSDYHIVNGYTVCDSCYQYRYNTCHICDSQHHIDDMYYINQGWTCDSCVDRYYTPCYNCGNQTHIDDIYSVNGRSLCSNCFDRYAAECSGCDEYFFRHHLHDGLCEDCYEEQGEEGDEEAC